MGNAKLGNHFKLGNTSVQNINKYWENKHKMDIGMLLEGLLYVQPFQFFSFNSTKKQYNY